MKSQKNVSLLFLIAISGACVQPLSTAVAAGHDLALHGSLVNATCDVTLTNPASTQAGYQSIQVNNQLVLSVDRYRNACESQALPLQTRYTEQPVQASGARTGVVTLTWQ